MLLDEDAGAPNSSATSAEVLYTKFLGKHFHGIYGLPEPKFVVFKDSRSLINASQADYMCTIIEFWTCPMHAHRHSSFSTTTEIMAIIIVIGYRRHQRHRL